LFHFIRMYRFLYEIHMSEESHVCGLQLIRRLQGQDGDVAGEEVPATPKRIFQILNQVTFLRFNRTSVEDIVNYYMLILRLL
jgi:hypothetical protein